MLQLSRLAWAASPMHACMSSSHWLVDQQLCFECMAVKFLVELSRLL